MLTKDTYGSKLRNLLSPFYNITQIIEDYKNGKLNDEVILKFLKQEELSQTFYKILDFSQEKLLEETIYEK